MNYKLVEVGGFEKGDKQPPLFIEDEWGLGGRRFKSSHPDFDSLVKPVSAQSA